MVLDSESPSVFGIGVADGQFLRQMRITDQMLLMIRVLRLDRERRVTRPLACCVHPTAVNAARARCIRGPDATGHGNEPKQPRREQQSHPQTFHFAVPATCLRLEPERAR
jgi:hypothetical protein